MSAVSDRHRVARRRGVAGAARRLERGLYRFRRAELSLVGLAIAAILVFVVLFGPWLVPRPEQIVGGDRTASRFLAAFACLPFGTNELGQDMLSLVAGGSAHLGACGLAVVAIGAVFGTLSERSRAISGGSSTRS